MDIEVLPIEENKRVGSSLHYEYGERFVHVFGGMDIVNYSHVNWYFKFDVNALKWVEGKPICHELFKPGSLLSRDGATLFVFGGCDYNSVESLDITDD